MFDVEQQIDQWKKRFTSMGVMRGSDIEELEQHVRDSMTALTALGLNPEEAFILARHRVGAPGPVEREFAKVNGAHLWTQRVFWMAAGALGYILGGLVIGAMASLGQVLVSLGGGRGAAAGYTAAGITVLGWAVMAAWLYLRRIGHSRTRFTGLSRRAIGGGVAAALAVASVLRFGSQLVLPGVMPVGERVQALMISSVAAAMSAVLIPVVLLIVMLSAGRRMHDSGAVGP